MNACTKCKFAALCLSSEAFKGSIVRCTVCGHFRIQNRRPNGIPYKNIDPLPCLHIPKLQKNRCHICAKGIHYKIRLVWPSARQAYFNHVLSKFSKRAIASFGVPRDYLGLSTDDD